MTNEEKTHNLFIATNNIEPLLTYKRGILIDSDEYKINKEKMKNSEIGVKKDIK